MHKIRRFALAASGVAFLTSLLAASGPARAAETPAVVLSGSVGRLPGASALIEVQVGLPYGANNTHHIPAGFHYPVVAHAVISSSNFSIAVPESQTLQHARELGHGLVEFNILVYSGSRFTSEMYPVALTQTAAHGNMTVLAQAQRRSATLNKFRAFAADPPATRRTLSALLGKLSAGGTIPDAGCGAVADGSAKEDLTRIGEIHVADTSGLSMRWNYYNTSDTDLSVGISTSSDTGGWSNNGTYTTSNSLGTGSGFTAPKGTLIYSDGDMYYQRYLWTGGAPLCHYWTNQVTSAVGDSREGTNSPNRNPYGGCSPGTDPLGYAQIDPHNGSFSTDRATAQGYSDDATLFGFSFSGHTGFTSSIHHEYDYNNPGGGYSYVCGGGSGKMSNSSILYSGTY